MQLVAEHAERMVVVDAGRIAADGATADVFADDALLERTGLRMPPLRRALHGLASHPDLAGVARLTDLPGGER
jgi:energy-coupling factor transport system ATP-binding protein